MAGVTVFVSTDVALQGADLVSGGQPANVKKGVELLLLNNLHTANGPSVPSRGQSDVSVLLRQGLDFLSKSPHDALGVPVGCRTPEVRKAYKKLALKYHPDKNPLTTPLFQLMSNAHDRLTDPVQRQKEERTAAAKNPKPTPKPPQQQQPSAAPPSGFPSAAAGHGGAYSNGTAGSNPAQAKQSYDPKTGKWSADAEWGKYQQQPTGSTAADQASAKAQEAARRKQYYDEILREQFKKAESDRKAKEFAAMKEAQAKQRAQGAAGGAAGYYSASGAKPDATSADTGASANAGANHYNYQNPHMKYPYPGQQNTTGAGTGAGGNSSAHGANPSYYSHYTRPTPPSDPTAQGGLNSARGSAGTGAAPTASAATAGTGNGSYAGRHSNYKPIPEAAKVNPQNVPLYGKIPSSREAPPSAGAAKPDSSRRGSDPTAADGYSYPVSRGSAAGTAGTATSARTATGTGTGTGAAGLGSGAGIAAGASSAAGAGGGAGSSARSGTGAGSDHGGSSSNLRGSTKPNASRVPRPYGLRCLFVGANAAELEWVTSKYHRNNLLAELSWRIKEGDMNASWRGTWESASKLISSGKCRKKNLVVGATYEFRVRAVEELAGGLLGYRSDWSDSITVQLLPDKTTYSNGGSASTAQGQGTSAASPSHRGLGAKPSGRGKDSAAFSFPDADEKQSKGAAAESSTGQQKTAHTFERFTTKAAEPRVNIYDTINAADIREKIDPKAGAPTAKGGTNKTAATGASAASATATATATAADGRRSTSTLPAAGTPTQKSATGVNTSSTSNLHAKAKVQAQGQSSANSPLPDIQKINLDNAKRYSGGANSLNGMGGSGRNVWGPDSVTPTDSPSSTAKDAKTTKGNATSKQPANAKKGDAANSSDDGEIEEDIQDNRSIAEEAREVDDEVNTVGVDEDSQSVQTTSAAKPAKAVTSNGQVGKTSAESKTAAATAGTGAGAGQHAKKPSKGEFADFTIEVEDGTDVDDDDEDEDTEYDEDDFDVEYEELYTLVAPPSRVKAVKKSASSANLGIYSHPVRAEPVPKSTIVGYLVLGTDVVACADAGNWLKVRIHKQPTRKNSMRSAEDAAEWGWSLRADKQHEYLKPNKESLPPLHHPHFTKDSPAPKGKGSYYAPSTPLKSSGSLGTPLGNRSMTALPNYPNGAAASGGAGATRQPFNERDVPVWMELFDVSGHAYYFNEATGESKWEPPEWVEERDPATGAKYYVNLGSATADPNAPLHSTWNKPAEYARLLRT